MIEDKNIGKKYNKWLVLERIPKTRPAKYICQCSCGIKSEVYLGNLTRELSKNCKYCQRRKKSEHLIGKKIGKLTLIGLPVIDGKTRHLVQCECGAIKHIRKNPNGKDYNSCGRCKINQQIGKKLGKLEILKYENKKYECICECGNLCLKTPKYIRKSKQPSCGCLIKQKNINRAKLLEGIKYFYLTIKKYLGSGEDKRSLYRVKCKCGNSFETSISYLFGSKSCGCLQKESVPKGSLSHMSKTNETEVIVLRQLFETKLYSRKELSNMFNLAYEHVCTILKKTTWKHVK